MENGLIIHYLSIDCERMYLDNIEYIHCTDNRGVNKVYRNIDNGKDYTLIYEYGTDDPMSPQFIIRHYYETGTIIQNTSTEKVTKYYEIEPYMNALEDQSIELIEFHNCESGLFYMCHMIQKRFEIRQYDTHTSFSPSLYSSSENPISQSEFESLRNRGWW